MTTRTTTAKVLFTVEDEPDEKKVLRVPLPCPTDPSELSAALLKLFDPSGAVSPATHRIMRLDADEAVIGALETSDQIVNTGRYLLQPLVAKKVSSVPVATAKVSDLLMSVPTGCSEDPIDTLATKAKRMEAQPTPLIENVVTVGSDIPDVASERMMGGRDFDVLPAVLMVQSIQAVDERKRSGGVGMPTDNGTMIARLQALYPQVPRVEIGEWVDGSVGSALLRYRSEKCSSSVNIRLTRQAMFEVGKAVRLVIRCFAELASMNQGGLAAGEVAASALLAMMSQCRRSEMFATRTTRLCLVNWMIAKGILFCTRNDQGSHERERPISSSVIRRHGDAYHQYKLLSSEDIAAWDDAQDCRVLMLSLPQEETLDASELQLLSFDNDGGIPPPPPVKPLPAPTQYNNSVVMPQKRRIAPHSGKLGAKCNRCDVYLPKNVSYREHNAVCLRGTH